MRHRVFGKKLGRTKDERQALFKGLAQALILRGAIVTTQAKAQAVHGLVDKLVTRAKKQNDAAWRLLFAFFQNEQVVKLLVNQVAPGLIDRPGGYTRLIKMGVRKGDGAPLVRMEWVKSVEIKTVSKQETPATGTPQTKIPKKARSKTPSTKTKTPLLST